MRVQVALLGFLMADTACGISGAKPSQQTEASESGQKEEAGTTEDATPTGPSAGNSSDAETGAADSDSSNSAEDGSDEAGEDTSTGDSDADCSVFAQDCPKGQRCVVEWEPGIPLNLSELETRCDPIVAEPKQAGESCTRAGEPGEDNCDLGAICYAYSEADLCVNFCGPEQDFTCRSEDEACIGSSSEGPVFCLPKCDPVDPECDGVWSNCQRTYPTEDDFVCYADFTEPPEAMESCIGHCASGLVCLSPDVLGLSCEGDDPRGCCTSYCDTSKADPDAACQAIDPSLKCVPLCRYGDILPEHEALGVCTTGELELNDHCPPEDDVIDLTYPWCSGENSSRCPDHWTKGGSDADGDYCWCYVDCNEDSDCPVPETGSVTPVCREADPGGRDHCTLPCDDDAECPKGMTCWGSCMWFRPDPLLGSNP